MAKRDVKLTRIVEGLVALLLAALSWWALTVWNRIDAAEEDIRTVDKRQQKLETIVEQQGEFNKRLLEVIDQRRRRSMSSEPTPEAEEEGDAE